MGYSRTNSMDWSREIRVPFHKYAGYGGYGHSIKIGNIKLYLSGSTVVAFSDEFNGLVISENMWGQCSGYHLNCIDYNHDKRIPYPEFRLKLINSLRDNGIFTNLAGMEENLNISRWG